MLRSISGLWALARDTGGGQLGCRDKGRKPGVQKRRWVWGCPWTWGWKAGSGQRASSRGLGGVVPVCPAPRSGGWLLEPLTSVSATSIPDSCFLLAWHEVSRSSSAVLSHLSWPPPQPPPGAGCPGPIFPRPLGPCPGRPVLFSPSCVHPTMLSGPPSVCETLTRLQGGP